jgi:hypothetical protein
MSVYSREKGMVEREREGGTGREREKEGEDKLSEQTLK